MADADPILAKKPKRRRTPPDTADPVEIAIAHARAAGEPEAARLLIEEQTRLVRLLAASERMRLTLRGMTAIIGMAVAIAVTALMWSASQASGLVINAFSVPPELAQRGLSGEAVASQLLDRVRRLDEGVDTVRATSSYANGWDGNVVVEIPNIGISM